MSNYKIRVNSKSESKEAQQLFFELGYEKGVCSTGGYPALIIATPESRFQKTPYSSRATSLNHEAHSQYKEITLPELSDLVVLKRNDPNDGTHIDRDNKPWYVTSDNLFYCFEYGREWVKENQRVFDNYEVKPIEKPMKEYLDKQQDGTYKLIKADGGCIDRDWIEIPEGAIKAYLNNSKTINFINANDDYMNHVTKGEWVSTHRGMHEKCGHVLVWSRHAHPEELPFIDDEPLQSLNDQYAEIETVRQSAWQKQEGGSHYKNLKIQPMQYALENKLDYAQANVVKYVTRHKEKNGKEDLLKAIHNLELMIEFYYGER